MIQFVPAILAKTEEEFREKIERVRPLGLRVQIDVMDGQFVNNTTWADVGKIAEILGDIPFEAHLMVANPEHQIMIWLAAGAERVFFHAEATNREAMIMRAAGILANRIGLAINPETPLSRLTPVIDTLPAVLVMGVTPGFDGQTLQPIAFEKIQAIKRLRPSIHVSVDGGINPQNVWALVEAGADALVVGSALTNAADPTLALALLHDEIVPLELRTNSAATPPTL
jgi:ribulose-phosphate 3-epimerase